MVLRVSRIIADVPAMASTHFDVAVATPERWHIRFNAVRSAVNINWVGASTRANTSPDCTRSPSFLTRSTLLAVGPQTISTAAIAISSPARHPFAREPKVTTLRCSSGTVATLVMSIPPSRSSETVSRMTCWTYSALRPCAARRESVTSDSEYKFMPRPPCVRQQCDTIGDASSLCVVRQNLFGDGNRGSLHECVLLRLLQ